MICNAWFHSISRYVSFCEIPSSYLDLFQIFSKYFIPFLFKCTGSCEKDFFLQHFISVQRFWQDGIWFKICDAKVKKKINFVKVIFGLCTVQKVVKKCGLLQATMCTAPREIHWKRWEGVVAGCYSGHHSETYSESLSWYWPFNLPHNIFVCFVYQGTAAIWTKFLRSFCVMTFCAQDIQLKLKMRHYYKQKTLKLNTMWCPSLG